MTVPKYEIFYESESGISPYEFNGPFLYQMQRWIFGDGGTDERQGHVFTPFYDAVLDSITVQTSFQGGSIIDSMNCKLYLDGGGYPSGSPIAVTSNPLIPGQSNVFYTFRFPKVFLSTSQSYFIEFTRTGSRDINNYQLIRGRIGVPIQHRLYTRNSGVWSQHGSYGFYIALNLYAYQLKLDPELNKRAMSFTLDIGKNDIDGKFKEGKADITFQNKDSYLNPNDGGNFELNRLIRVSTIEDRTLMEGCEQLNWTPFSAALSPVLNNTDQIEGNYCLELGKDGTNQNWAYYITLPSPFNATGLEASMTLKIKDLLVLAQGGNAISLNVGNDLSNMYFKNFTRNLLTTGYQELGKGELLSDWGSIGSPNIAAINYLRINFQSPTIGTLVPIGDFIMDDWHLGINNNLFTGFTTRAKPALNIEDKSLAVTLSDLFAPLLKQKVSVGLQSGKKVSELVKTLLNSASISPIGYNVSDDDTTILNAVTWNNVTVKSKLEKCVEVGQHHHFMDGSGIYQFKDNQWLSDPTPKYIYDLVDMDDYDFEFDLKGVYNNIKVEYPTSQTTDDKDVDSILRYGKRVKEIINELMPSGGAYAQAVSLFLLDQLNNAKKGVTYTLQNRYPDMVETNLGDIISIVNPFLDGVYDLYVVMGMNRKVDSEGTHDLKVRCKEWISPAPMEDWYEIIPFDFSDAFKQINPNYGRGDGQSFTIEPTTAKLRQISAWMVHSLAGGWWFNIDIYAATAGGIPTGGILASSDPILIYGGYPGTYPEYVFPFSGSDRITLTSGNKYCWFVRHYPSFVTNKMGFMQHNADIYNGGIAFYMNTVGAWVPISSWDRYFNVRLEI